jgi:hypothetical protein
MWELVYQWFDRRAFSRVDYNELLDEPDINESIHGGRCRRAPTMNTLHGCPSVAALPWFEAFSEEDSS